jgi:hypothetical protein
MSAHAVYAPSSAHRWIHCTASAEAIAQLGEQEEGEEAAKGTQAHEEIERVLGPYSGDGLGLWLEKPEHLAVNPDHPAAYGVALVLDFVRQLPPGTIWIEQRVRLTDKIWGRCDVCHWHPESATLTIVDYKNGFVNVEAEWNEQLRIYGAGSIYTHGLPVKWVRYVVVQPNSILPVPRVKQWIESADDLFAFAQHAAAIPDGPKTFTAGEQCKYCPLFGRCPASADVLLKLGAMLANPPDTVRPEQVATFKACEKPIKDWFTALDKAQTKKALATGNPPPGMKLVTATKHRDWKDENAARAYIAVECGIEALSPPTPAQAEKLVPKEWVEANSHRPPGAPVLAFESDKRPEFKRPSGVEMFAGVGK